MMEILANNATNVNEHIKIKGKSILVIVNNFASVYTTIFVGFSNLRHYTIKKQIQMCHYVMFVPVVWVFIKIQTLMLYVLVLLPS